MTTATLTPSDLAAVAPSFYFDRWAGQYSDAFNNVWVSKPHGRKRWAVAFRDSGNVSTVIHRGSDLTAALAAAERFVTTRYCKNHAGRETREILDGEPLCQSCCENWARGQREYQA